MNPINELINEIKKQRNLNGELHLSASLTGQLIRWLELVDKTTQTQAVQITELADRLKALGNQESARNGLIAAALTLHDNFQKGGVIGPVTMVLFEHAVKEFQKGLVS